MPLNMQCIFNEYVYHSMCSASCYTTTFQLNNFIYSIKSVELIKVNMFKNCRLVMLKLNLCMSDVKVL